MIVFESAPRTHRLRNALALNRDLGLAWAEEENRTMIRRRRKPTSLRIESLESRTLLTYTATISIMAPNKSVDVVPNPGQAVTPAIFQVSEIPTGYAASAQVMETVSPSNAPLPSMFTSNGAFASGSYVTLGGNSPTTITINPPTSSPNNVDETVTLTLSNASGCTAAGYYNWTVGKSTDSITFHFPPVKQQTHFCDPSPVGLTESAGSGNATPSGTSDAGVAYGDGGVSPRSPSLLESNGFGSIPFGVNLGWTNLPGFGEGSTPGYAADGSIFGIGMIASDLPSLEADVNGGLIALGDAGNAIFFGYNDSVYTPQLYSQDTLAVAVDNANNFKFTQTDGTVVEYYGFGSSIPVAQRGQLDYYTDPGGNSTSTTYNSNGQLMSVGRASGGASEVYSYNYVGGSGVNAGLVSNVALMRTPAGGSSYKVQQVAFTYYSGTYTGSDTSGNAGDLKNRDPGDQQWRGDRHYLLPLLHPDRQYLWIRRRFEISVRPSVIRPPRHGQGRSDGFDKYIR